MARILVLSELIPGGEWIATSRLVDAVKKTHRGFRFSLLAFGNKRTYGLDNFEKKILIKRSKTKKHPVFFRNLINDFLLVRTNLLEIQKKEKIDFILGTNFLMVLSAITIPSQNTKVIFFFHGIKSTLFRRISDINRRQLILKVLEWLSLILPNATIVPSDFAKKYVLDVTAGFLNKKDVFVVPNFVPEIFFNPPTQKQTKTLRARLDATENDKLLFYSGRIAKFKGLENLIKAFIGLKKRNGQRMLILASPSEGVDAGIFRKIKRVVSGERIHSRVKFLFDSTAQELNTLYHLSDVLILPSELEFAPLSVLEALAAKTPAVVTDKGNMKEIVVGVDPNLVLKNNSPSQIQRTLEYFFSLTPKEISLLKGRCHKIALGYSSSDSVSKFIRILDSF
jgi:glycosyltransferase involved in cell wall biosynthesis